jgi:hypothetical protein
MYCEEPITRPLMMKLCVSPPNIRFRKKINPHLQGNSNRTTAKKGEKPFSVDHDDT